MTNYLDYHQFAVGEQRILVAEQNLFKQPFNSTQVTLVRITIQTETIVSGNYQPENRYYGYRALGDDGNYYTCQWQKYDEVSTAPYNNWSREPIKGIDYIDGSELDKTQWIGDNIELYFLWDVETMLRSNPTLINRLAQEFPYTIYYCDAMWSWDDGHTNTDTTKRHNQWYYSHQQCPYCKFQSMPQHLAPQAEGTVLVRKFGQDKLVLSFSRQVQYANLPALDLYELTYLARMDDEFWATETEHFLVDEGALAYAQFERRANANNPMQASSYRLSRSLETLVQNVVNPGM